MEDSLSPDALFSPSKARQQRAQANDWQHVETWLSSLYPNRALPAFERNDETLKALLALAAANERANEEKRLVEALEDEVRAELDEIDRNPADVSADLLGAVIENLTEEGEASLSALAELTTTLSAPSADSQTLGLALISQTQHSHQIAIQEQTVSTLHALFDSDLETLRNHLRSITSDPSFTAPSSLSRQTADYTRQTKQLRMKLREYTDRLASLPPPSPSSGFHAMSSAGLGEVKAKEQRMGELKNEAARMEARVKAFKDLPADKEEARQRVRARERELEALKRERDAGFGKLVER